MPVGPWCSRGWCIVGHPKSGIPNCRISVRTFVRDVDDAENCVWVVFHSSCFADHHGIRAVVLMEGWCGVGHPKSGIPHCWIGVRISVRDVGNAENSVWVMFHSFHFAGHHASRAMVFMGGWCRAGHPKWDVGSVQNNRARRQKKHGPLHPLLSLSPYRGTMASKIVKIIGSPTQPRSKKILLDFFRNVPTRNPKPWHATTLARLENSQHPECRWFAGEEIGSKFIHAQLGWRFSVLLAFQYPALGRFGKGGACSAVLAGDLGGGIEDNPSKTTHQRQPIKDNGVQSQRMRCDPGMGGHQVGC